MQWFSAFTEFFRNLSFTEGAMLILVVLFYRGTIKSYHKRLDDRQKEIDRLAADNREYRERFVQLMDRELKLRSDQNSQ